MSLTETGKEVIRWGIIGCGNVTEVKSGPAYQLTNGFELIAVMRRDAVKAEDYARRHQVPKFYFDADQLIHDPEVNAVYIATPPDSHKYYALKVAEAGKACCIEKPMASNYEDSLAIQRAFERKKLPLFIAYYRRTLPRFTKIKSWLEDNLIGEIMTVHWTLHKPPSQIDLSQELNWRTDSRVAPGGYFDDLASHGLDLFTYLMGQITEAKGISSNQQKLYSARDRVTATWIHKSGVAGSGDWNFGTDYHKDEVIITGSKGAVLFSIFDNAPLILKHNEGEIELEIEHPKPIQLHHVNAMRDHMLYKNLKHPSTGNSGLHTSWVMDKILGKI